MATDKWWEHLDESEYRKWRADEFASKARDEFARRRAPKPAPLPEPAKEGDGGLLGGLKKMGGLALKPFELERKYVSGPIAETYMKIPKPVRIGLAAPTGVGALAQALIPEKATKEAATILASPSTYMGLGLAGKAATKIPAVAKYAPAVTKLEDIAIGGPAFRAAGRGIMAPFKAAARRIAPDVAPRVGAEAAGDFRIKVYDLAVDRKRLASAGKLTNAIRDAVKPARAETELLYTQERARRAARLGEMPADLGEEALKEQAKILKGPLPKAGLETPKVDQEDIFNLFEHINQADIPVYDKVAARNALAKLIGPEARERGYAEIPGMMEIARLQKLFGTEFAEAIRAQRPLGQKAWQNVMETVNLPRAVLAAYDLSAPLRQGALLAGVSPKAWGKNLGPMVRAFVDEDYAMALNRSLKELRPEIIETSGVHIAPLGAGAELAAREEAMMTKFAGQIPGLRMSERAYVTYLNKLRRDVLLGEVNMWERNMGRAVDLSNAADVAELKNMGKWVNILSGRGDLGTALNRQAPLLGIGLFSPRLLAARVETPFGLLASSGKARMMVAKGIAGLVGANLAVLGLMKMSGAADVELDPRSTDFGKLRIGRTRLDFWGGFQPMARYTAQLITGKRKTTVAGEVYGIDRKDAFTSFIETKLSPPMGLAVDVWRERTFLGEPLTGETLTEGGELSEQAKNRLMPMFMQDLADAVQHSGVVPGTFLAVPGAFGASVMSYAWPSQRLDELSQEHMNQRWRDLNFEERKVFFDKVPEARETYKELVEQGVRRGQEWAEGMQERMESDEELQARLAQALDQGAPKADVARDYQAYRSSRSFTGDPDREPRDEMEALVMEYWGTKPEDFIVNGLVDWETFYQTRDDFLAAHPGAKETLDSSEALRWTDPAMRGFVQEYQRANDLWAQYYDIPSKLGMSPEEQKEARGVLAQVTTLQFMNPGLSTRQALTQLDVPDRLKFLALRYSRLRSNPEREAFRTKYGTEMALIKPPEFGAAVTEEVAR